MARMYPEHIEGSEDATEGEKRVFRFLKEAARPHRDFTCWYQPSLGSQGKVPDFVLYAKKLGLLVLEVKDCFYRSFLHATIYFRLRKNRAKDQPAGQAKAMSMP
jgi:hypothetical protein